jgi:hypothetical protein
MLVLLDNLCWRGFFFVEKNVSIFIFFNFYLIRGIFFVSSESFLLDFNIVSLIDELVVEFVPFLFIFDEGVIMASFCIASVDHSASQVEYIFIFVNLDFLI